MLSANALFPRRAIFLQLVAYLRTFAPVSSVTHPGPVEWLLAALVVSAVTYHLIVGGRALDRIHAALRLEQDEQDAFPGTDSAAADPERKDGSDAI